MSKDKEAHDDFLKSPALFEIPLGKHYIFTVWWDWAKTFYADYWAMHRYSIGPFRLYWYRYPRSFISKEKVRHNGRR